MKKTIGYILLAPAFLLVGGSAVVFYAATWLYAYDEGWLSIICYALAHATLLGMVLVLQED